MTELAKLRSKRTRASNAVRDTIRHLLTDPIKWRLDGRLAELPADQYALPSWWPFWSDVLKQHVIATVRAARELETAEREVNR